VIGRKIRSDAAMVCALNASSHRVSEPLFYDTCLAVGVDYRPADGVANLAATARKAAFTYTGEPRTEDRMRSIWAEAEALLRTGWNPPHDWRDQW
jgi:hypothetical protein